MSQSRNEKAYAHFKHRPFQSQVGKRKLSDREIRNHRFSKENMDRSIEELAKELSMTPVEYEDACRRAMREDAICCIAKRNKHQLNNKNFHTEG